MTLTELVDHIERTHHAYLREELPRLDVMTEKVARVHGDKEPRLRRVREAFVALKAELDRHMMKEERILFPMVRQLEASLSQSEFHCGSVANPIRQMEHEHDQAGEALAIVHNATDGFVPPEWACNTYRAMLDAPGTTRIRHASTHSQRKQRTVSQDTGLGVDRGPSPGR